MEYFQSFGRSKKNKRLYLDCLGSECGIKCVSLHIYIFILIKCLFRGTEFKEDDAIWKGGEDGGVGGGGPPPAGMGAAGPTGGYVAK